MLPVVHPIRTSNFSVRWTRSFVMSLIRLAPKRKKQINTEEPAVENSLNEEADHVFNIYKHLPDHEIDKDENYPHWVKNIGKEKLPTYGELEMKFIYGKKIESATLEEYRRFQKLHRRNLIRLNNMRLATHYKRIQFEYKNV